MKCTMVWLKGVSRSLCFVGLTTVVVACYSSGFAQEPTFADRVLNNTNCRYCYFVVLVVESTAYSGEIVIENDELMTYLVAVGETTESEYPAYARKLLKTGTPLRIRNATLGEGGLTLVIAGISENQFRIPKPDDTMNKNLVCGCTSAIDALFEIPTGTLEKKRVNDNCQEYFKSLGQASIKSKEVLTAGNDAALIAMLFKWQLPVRIEHRTGLLLIDGWK